MGRNSNHLGLRRKFEFSPFPLSILNFAYCPPSSSSIKHSFYSWVFLSLWITLMSEGLILMTRLSLRVMLWNCPMIVGLIVLVPFEALFHPPHQHTLMQNFHLAIIQQLLSTSKHLFPCCITLNYESCATKCYSYTKLRNQCITNLHKK